MAKRTTRKVKSDREAQRLLEMTRKVNSEQPQAREVANLDELRQNPEVWRAVSDLKEMAHTVMLRPFAPTARALIRQQIETLQEKLGYAGAPMIERLLIEQIGTSWLYLHLIQMICMSGNGVGWEKRLTAAQSRYLKAIETLTQVRRRLRPSAVQVNIGAQQVNVAGKVETGRGRATE